MSREIAISDIHGCLASFEQLLHNTLEIGRDDDLYLLGDYIDRGPASKGVIDHIMALREDGYNVTCLMGNHEEILLRFNNGNSVNMKSWNKHGGRETLASFGVDSALDIPETYWDFFESLDPYAETSECILVHAGLDFSLEDPFTDTYSMMWARNYEVDQTKLRGKKLVHGHTPKSRECIERDFDNNNIEINIDNGCVYKGVRPGMGELVAYDMTNNELYFQPNVDF